MNWPSFRSGLRLCLTALALGAVLGLLARCGDEAPPGLDRGRIHGPEPLAPAELELFARAAAAAGADSRVDGSQLAIERVAPFACRDDGTPCCVHTETYKRLGDFPGGTWDFRGWSKGGLITLPADPAGVCPELLPHELLHQVGRLVGVREWYRHGWTAAWCAFSKTCCRAGECP